MLSPWIFYNKKQHFRIWKDSCYFLSLSLDFPYLALVSCLWPSRPLIECPRTGVHFMLSWDLSRPRSGNFYWLSFAIAFGFWALLPSLAERPLAYRQPESSVFLGKQWGVSWLQTHRKHLKTFFFGLLRRFCTFNTDKDFQKLMEVLHCLKWDVSRRWK